MRAIAAKALRRAAYGATGSPRTRHYTYAIGEVLGHVRSTGQIVAGEYREKYQSGKRQWRAASHAKRAAFRRAALKR